jgi:hypothetical protein
MEEKLSSNLFLGNLVLDQEEDPYACSADQGPNCFLANGKTVNHMERGSSDDYYHNLNNGYRPRFTKAMRNVKKALENRGGFPSLRANSSIVFYPNGRQRLDQALYPNNYPAVHTFTFTFETFKPEQKTFKPVTDVVDFKLDSSVFVLKPLNKMKNLGM